MDWLLHGVSSLAGSQGSVTKQNGQQPRPSVMPQMQGDPTFLYGGYGYRPPTLGYAWLNNASQPTSYGQLPTDTGGPLTLTKSVSAPDLQNTSAVQQLQSAAQQVQQHQSQPQQHGHVQGTPPLPRHRHNKHLSAAHLPPGTPGEQSAANTPSSSRASTPPRRAGIGDSFYIGMAAA